MTDRRQRQPASDQAPHAIPKDAAILATLGQRTVPEPPNLEPKQAQRRCVHGHPVIARVSTHHRLQPLTLFGDGFVQASLKWCRKARDLGTLDDEAAAWFEKYGAMSGAPK